VNDNIKRKKEEILKTKGLTRKKKDIMKLAAGFITYPINMNKLLEKERYN
jgi:hypothetical protein